ncbi:MAG TPA: hypothetical protein VF502_05695, partial [Stellaceae bacterium]
MRNRREWLAAKTMVLCLFVSLALPAPGCWGAPGQLAAKWYHWPFETDREGVSLDDDHIKEYFNVFLGRPFDPIYLEPMATWSLQHERK